MNLLAENRDATDPAHSARETAGAGRRPFVTLAALLLGIAAAHAMMPRLFRSVVSDVSRVGMILDTLRREDLHPGIVVVGSSVVTSGVDTAALGRALPGEPLALNLSSPMQNLAESYLLYQELPPSVCVVVQMVTPYELSIVQPFSAIKFNAYYMYGFRPSPETVKTMQEVFGEPATAVMVESAAKQRFLARWHVNRFLDYSYWWGRWTTPQLESWARDVFFFPVHHDRLGEPNMSRSVALWSQYVTAVDAAAVGEKRRLASEMIASVRSAGRRILWFVPPTHPGVRAATADDLRAAFGEMLAALREPPVSEVVDLQEAEPETAFSDGTHLTAEGAARFTRALVERLRSMPPCAEAAPGPQ